MLYPRNNINKINKKGLKWDTPKNTVEEERWAQKKEELEKEIKRNKIKLFL